MVVWNDVPTREILYLGKDVQRIDMLGRAGPCNEEEGAQLLDVEAVPAFITGLHPAITRWNISLDFEQRQVPSVFSRPHANVLMFHNSFDQGVGGSVTIVVPQLERDGGFDETIDAPETAGTTDRWTIDPAQATFRLAAGEVARLPFEIRLRNAMYGKQPIRVDFKVEADEPCQFSVYREMEVGTGALSLRVQTYLDDDGSLVVKQVMTNQSDTLPDFKCYLYGGPRRQRMQVYRLGADEDTKVYRFPNGRALLGKQMMLEIEELNGERVLRHGFVVTDSPDNEADAAVQEPTESAARHAEEAAGSNAGDA
jgi:hypothetical protein